MDARSAERALTGVQRLGAHLAGALQADLVLRLWDGQVVKLGPQATGDLAVAIRSPRTLTRLLRRPRLATLVDLLAAGEIEIEGGTLLDVAARRGSAARGVGKRLNKWLIARALLPYLFGRSGPVADSQAYAGQDRTGGDARDDQALVQFHYDLSNAFYALFLDPELQYSCGYFADPAADIAQAQQAKLEMICRKLRLQPGDRFLDIGCGWGGLVCHAAAHHGVQAHGVTLSAAQHAFALEKVARLGLGNQVTVELRDYRELSGEYDRIASIGMFEHVGWDDQAAYFRKMRGLLRPRGVMLHHAITRPAKGSLKRFRRKRPEYAAIVKYIFPGSELDHIGHTLESLESAGFEVHDVEGWREHYGRTTRLWCERLYANRAAAEREVGAAKTRLWLLYLAGVSLGFDRGGLGIYQTVVTKRARGTSEMPWTRADLYAAP